MPRVPQHMQSGTYQSEPISSERPIQVVPNNIIRAADIIRVPGINQMCQKPSQVNLD